MDIEKNIGNIPVKIHSDTEVSTDISNALTKSLEELSLGSNKTEDDVQLALVQKLRSVTGHSGTLKVKVADHAPVLIELGNSAKELREALNDMSTSAPSQGPAIRSNVKSSNETADPF
ncbi:hypothetical protein DID77_01675 [Candidatus Marinamargulisbacteria bacterium SCGC AG-439-L15]|nr:hypothetical protein DID77_01675 [Candidatus Marinamargulisbacteria bacterium SCGC AG-439-L15]